MGDENLLSPKPCRPVKFGGVWGGYRVALRCAALLVALLVRERSTVQSCPAAPSLLDHPLRFPRAPRRFASRAPPGPDAKAGVRDHRSRLAIRSRSQLDRPLLLFSTEQDSVVSHSSVLPSTANFRAGAWVVVGILCGGLLLSLCVAESWRYRWREMLRRRSPNRWKYVRTDWCRRSLAVASALQAWGSIATASECRRA